MKIFHYNDEERELQRALEQRGHSNAIVSARQDPFLAARSQLFDSAFIGLHPHGLELIRVLHRSNPDCLVTLVTEDRNTRTAVEAMKLGAFDYLLTPLDFGEVERTIIMMTREHQGQQERRGLEGRLSLAHSRAREGEIPLKSGSLKQALHEVERILIERALDDHRGNISAAAASLDISRTTLYTKLRQEPTDEP